MKEACSDGKYGEGLITLAASVGALVTGGASALAFGAVGAASGAAGLAFDICENDPPDPDYKGLFRPKVPTLPRVRAGGRVSRAAARAVNRMLVNQARSSAYITAWIRSIEKSQGAAQVGDTEWVRRQRDAAAKHARNAAAKLQRDIPLRRAARRELRRSGALDVDVTAKQARRLKGQIKRRGLPKPMLRALRSAGANRAEVAQVKRTLLAVNPNAAADLGVFGEVNDPRFRKANATMVQTLRRSASSLSSSPRESAPRHGIPGTPLRRAKGIRATELRRR